MSRECLGRPTEDLIVEARLAVIKGTFPAHCCHLCEFRSTASMSHLTTWAAAGHGRFTSKLKLSQFRASLLLLKKKTCSDRSAIIKKSRIISQKTVRTGSGVHAGEVLCSSSCSVDPDP